MWGIGLGDQPIIATVNPDVETMRANKIDRLARDVRRHRLLRKDREIPFDEQSAIEASDRCVEIERIEQHGHAAWRAAAGDREADAGMLQGFDGVLGASCQNLLFSYERAVHVCKDQRNLPSHCHDDLRGTLIRTASTRDRLNPIAQLRLVQPELSNVPRIRT